MFLQYHQLKFDKSTETAIPSFITFKSQLKYFMNKIFNLIGFRNNIVKWSEKGFFVLSCHCQFEVSRKKDFRNL